MITRCGFVHACLIQEHYGLRAKACWRRSALVRPPSRRMFCTASFAGSQNPSQRVHQRTKPLSRWIARSEDCKTSFFEVDMHIELSREEAETLRELLQQRILELD